MSRPVQPRSRGRTTIASEPSGSEIVTNAKAIVSKQVKSALAGHCALRAISANCKVSLPSINFQEQVAPLHRCRRIRTHQPGPSACNVLALKTEVTYFLQFAMICSLCIVDCATIRRGPAPPGGGVAVNTRARRAALYWAMHVGGPGKLIISPLGHLMHQPRLSCAHHGCPPVAYSFFWISFLECLLYIYLST